MKKSFFLLNLFICLQFVFSQETWQEATKIADSLSIINYDKALIFRKKAVELTNNESDKIKKLVNYLLAYSQTELKFKDPKNYTEAYNELKIIVTDIEKLNLDAKLYSHVYVNLLTYSYNYILNMSDAEKHVTKVLENLNNAESKDTLELISALHYKGVVSRNLSKLSNSITAFKKAIWLNERFSIKDTNLLGNLYVDYADIYRDANLNIPNKNYELLKKAENIYKSALKPDIMYFSAVYIRLMNLEKQLGNYENAIGYLNKNRQLILDNQEIQQSYQRGNVGVMKELQYYHYLVGIHRDLANEPEMLIALNKMINLEATKELSDYGNYFMSIGYRSAGQFYTKKNPKKAINFFNKGLSLNLKYKFLNTEFDFINEIAKAHINNGDLNKAINQLQKTEQNNNTPTKAKIQAYSLFAQAYIINNDVESSFSYINKCINELSKSEKKLDIKTLITGDYIPGNSLTDITFLVKIAERLKEVNQGYDKEINQLYWLSLKHFSTLFKGKVLNKKLNALYQRILDGVFNDCVTDKNISTEKLNLVLSAIENIESQFLLNRYLQNRELASKGIFTKSIVKEQEIRATITYLTKKYATSPNDKIKQLIFEEELKLKTLSENSKDSNINFYKPSFAFNDLNLSENHRIIRFKKAGDHFYKISITNKTISFKKINTTSLVNKVDTFVKKIKNINSKIQTIKKTGADLFKLLLDEDDIATNHLYIIPDDILHYLPFELLTHKQNYLIEFNTISYSNGLAFINQEKNTKIRQGKVALFAPSYNKYVISNEELVVRGEPYNLIGSREEIKSISNIITRNKIYDGDFATKDAFKNLDKDISIIHLSMHSFLNDDIPELNSLVFTDKTNDYELHISELYGLKLNADLAVLSACNTGVGKLKDGKAIVSMNNAFTYAGVPSTISSLWSAPDLSTKEIMVNFYKNLKNKETFSQSLRNAKLNYLKNVVDVELAHPYYWAGFVLYGNDQSIDLSNGNIVYLKWIGILLILGIILFIFKKYKN